MSDWGGTQKTSVEQDPSAQSLNQLRAKLATSVAGGDWSGMQGFFDKVLIPRTMGTLTAAGLGRSGALGEAVSNAQLQYGTEFLSALLSGVPFANQQEQQYEPGIMDWLQFGLGAFSSLGGMGMFSGMGGSGGGTTPSTWMGT